MKELMNKLSAREEELWEMKLQLPGLPNEIAAAAARKIEIELSQIGRRRTAYAMGKVA